MSWTKNYMEIPFEDVGRTRQGADCYGLPRLVLIDRCNIYLPLRSDYEDVTANESLSDYVQDGINDTWIPIPAGQEREYDFVQLRFMGLPIHLGIITDIKHHMMHTCEGQGVTVEDYRKGKWPQPGRIIGFYRHRDLCKM